MADVAVIVKEDTAPPAAVATVTAAIARLNPRATIVDTRMPISVEPSEAIRGKTVLAVEDGPTVTHGGMPAGAAELAARTHGATLVDPRPYARGSLRDVFIQFPTLGPVLPAMGYSAAQIADLQATIEATPCDAVLLGTPIDIRRSLTVTRPVVRARYRIEEVGRPGFEELLKDL
jgi:predicted GTPase